MEKGEKVRVLDAPDYMTEYKGQTGVFEGYNLTKEIPCGVKFKDGALLFFYESEIEKA